MFANLCCFWICTTIPYHTFIYSYSQTPFIHSHIKSNSNSGFSNSSSTVNSAVKPQLDYSTVLSLHCFVIQPFCNCRVSHRSAAVDGHKTMYHKTMQTRKQNKIRFSSVFRLRHKYFPGKFRSFLRITFLYLYQSMAIGPLNFTVQWPLVSHQPFLFVRDKKHFFYLLHTIQF